MSETRMRLDSEAMSDDGQKLLAFLLKNIKGQDSAVKDIVEADELFRSGLYSDDKPIYSALLLGPSGVGKTLTAEVLADYWFGSRSAFTKISCESMSEPHSVASLVGSPPGYVGFHDPGDQRYSGSEPILSQRKIDEPDFFSRDEVKKADIQIEKLYTQLADILNEIEEISSHDQKSKEDLAGLTELHKEKKRIKAEIYKLTSKVYSAPSEYRSIILFDEIEKANESLHNLLLNIIDKGKLTLKNGTVTDFTRSVILLTSNIGSNEIADLLDNKKIGFESGNSNNDGLNKNIYRHAEKAARSHFRPELLGRLNRISVFRPLDEEVMRMILESELAKFQENIFKSFPIIIKISEEAREFILREAMDRQQEGARLLRRKIDSYIREPFSRLKLRGEIKAKEDVLDVVLENGKLVFYRQKNNLGQPS